MSQLKSILQSGIRQIVTMEKESKAFEDELSNLYVRKDNVLCHYNSNDGNARIVIPRNLIPGVLQMMHNNLGHFGFKKTIQGEESRKSIYGPYCHLKLKIGVENAKCVNVEGIRYQPKSPTSTNFHIPPGGAGNHGYG